MHARSDVSIQTVFGYSVWSSRECSARIMNIIIYHIALRVTEKCDFTRSSAQVDAKRRVVVRQWSCVQLKMFG